MILVVDVVGEHLETPQRPLRNLNVRTRVVVKYHDDVQINALAEYLVNDGAEHRDCGHEDVKVPVDLLDKLVVRIVRGELLFVRRLNVCQVVA